MSLKHPISIITKEKRWRRILISGIFVGLVGVGILAYRYFMYPDSSLWQYYRDYLRAPEDFAEYTIEAGQRCGDAPFAFPSRGVVFGSWDQSYRPGHRHSGIDIFPATEPGVTPVYAAYDGYLTRGEDWISTIIIRIPDNPLNPGEQIWTYYTHMASVGGDSFIVDAFPPGTSEVFVEAGTLLGYQGNYSGDPTTPTGLHLHFSVVKDDGQGNYLNELDIRNTYDPSPYFNLPFNNNENPDEFAVCEGEVSYEGWGE